MEVIMNNRDVYQEDPATRKLVNEGVASVNDDQTSQALAVLRYELETFVCDGQYEKGDVTCPRNLPKQHRPSAAACRLGQRVFRIRKIAPCENAPCALDRYTF